jgi:hypothetical protein
VVNFCIAKSVMRRLRDLLPCRLRAALAERRAAVALIVAISAPVLIGFTALGTDVAYWYGSREAVQTAVDAAAISVAHFAAATTQHRAFEAVGVMAANQAVNNQFSGTSQCTTDAKTCEFNSSNLIVSVEACYKDGKGEGGGEIKCPGDPAYQSDKAASAGMSYPYGASVFVTANIPQPVFFIGALMNLHPTLQVQAASIIRINFTPPPNDTCALSTGDTGVSPGGAQSGLGSFHVGGVNFGSCGDSSLELTQSQMNTGYIGYLNQTAFYLNDNGGVLPTSPPQNVPAQAPSCSRLYNPSTPTINAGNPSSTSDDGTLVYFGPATTNGNDYSFSPILVEPGSGFCDVNNVCTLPAGAYCGGLQVNPGVTLNFVDHNGSANFMILDGNLVIPSNGISYGGANDLNAAFLFGGSSVGSLLQNTQTAIYPGQIQNGTLVYTTTTTTVVANTGNSLSADQICPGGVVPTGITPSGVPTCPAMTQVMNSLGQTNTTLSTTQTVAGQSTPAYVNNVGSTPFQQIDTYVTKITFKNGIPVYSQASETTTSGFYSGENGQYQQVSGKGGAINLSVNEVIGNNSAATPDANSDSCQVNDANNLFSSQTPAGNGYNFRGSAGQGYTQQVDTIMVCGTGPKLVANPTGAEIVASGTLADHIYLSQ